MAMYGNDLIDLPKYYHYLICKHDSYLISKDKEIVVFRERKRSHSNHNSENYAENITIFEIKFNQHCRFYDKIFIKGIFYSLLYLLLASDMINIPVELEYIRKKLLNVQRKSSEYVRITIDSKSNVYLYQEFVSLQLASITVLHDKAMFEIYDWENVITLDLNSVIRLVKYINTRFKFKPGYKFLLVEQSTFQLQ